MRQTMLRRLTLPDRVVFRLWAAMARRVRIVAGGSGGSARVRRRDSAVPADRLPTGAAGSGRAVGGRLGATRRPRDVGRVQQERAGQVVPGARRAHLDHVAGERAGRLARPGSSPFVVMQRPKAGRRGPNT